MNFGEVRFDEVVTRSITISNDGQVIFYFLIWGGGGFLSRFCFYFLPSVCVRCCVCMCACALYVQACFLEASFGYNNNKKKVPAQFKFRKQPKSRKYCSEWLSIEPIKGILMPSEKLKKKNCWIIFFYRLFFFVPCPQLFLLLSNFSLLRSPPLDLVFVFAQYYFCLKLCACVCTRK